MKTMTREIAASLVAGPWCTDSRDRLRAGGLPGEVGMVMSKIGFSAQFGGQDAAQAALPHLRALKAAALGVHLEYFPFAGLDFILRVDGEAHRFGGSGEGNLEIDRDGDCLSVDIGIGRDDRDRIPEVIRAALLSSVEQVRALRRATSRSIDFEALKACLIDLADRYEKEIGTGRAGTP
jgi:hypothetical protein